jgi:hypothetical protein
MNKQCDMAALGANKIADWIKIDNLTLFIQVKTTVLRVFSFITTPQCKTEEVQRKNGQTDQEISTQEKTQEKDGSCIQDQ